MNCNITFTSRNANNKPPKAPKENPTNRTSELK